MSIDKNNLPIDASNTVLSAACDTSIKILLNALSHIDRQKLTETYQIRDLILGMVSEIEDIKEGV